MTLSPDDLAETTDAARAYLSARRSTSTLVDDPAASFATALVSVSARFVVGMPCDRHGGEVHGQEAEELRAGVEQILGNTEDVSEDDAASVLQKLRRSLAFLLDRIDARDSLTACRKPLNDGEKWHRVLRQLGRLREALYQAALPEVEAAKDWESSAAAMKTSILMVHELAKMLEQVDSLLRELFHENGVSCG